jgi:pimeloyl-ACP methyl ester carboxylesterase
MLQFPMPTRMRFFWLIALIACTQVFAADPRVVGSLKLRSCGNLGAYCGVLDRPLDASGTVSGRVPLYFEFYPHTGSGPSQGVMVAVEGGPGYPSTGSREDYLALYQPLRGSRDVLLFDNRGTGRSGALDCRALQTAPRWTVEEIAACGTSLGPRSAFYGSADAADDLAALLEALRVERIDLYGDSDGTFFAQVFAVRHPAMLRSIVLDGAYALSTTPEDAWWPNYAPAMREKFNVACSRSPACAALPGSSIEHIAPALAQLRAHPDAHMSATQLAIVMFASAPPLATVRETDAAARAWVDGDQAPLLRLAAETNAGVDSRDPSADPGRWSAADSAAVMCQNLPQIFDMRLPPDQRAAERDRAIAAREKSAPGTYAPFTIAEYRGMPLDYTFLDQCVGWPVAPPYHPAGHPVPADAPYPDVPVLVLSSDLDNMTTIAEGAAAAREFKRGRQVILVNSFHVNAMPRSRTACGAELVRRFIETLDPGDARCAAEVPPVRLVARFARHATDLPPATAIAGNAANEALLRIAAAAVLTVGDAWSRSTAESSDMQSGLRGGTYRSVTHGDNLHVSLYQLRWTEDVAVSGALERPLARGGLVRARVSVTAAGGGGTLSIEWREGVADARAHIGGVLRGSRVAAEVAAP